MNSSRHKNLIVVALLASAAVGAMAQAPQATHVPPATIQAHAQHGGAGADAGFEQRRQLREQRLAQRLNRFKQTLQITPAQESAWVTWVEAMKPQRRAQRPNFVEFARMNTPQRIDAMRELRAQRTAAMNRRGEATKAFYASLSAEQREVFDEQGLRFAGGRAVQRGGHRHPGHHG